MTLTGSELPEIKTAPPGPKSREFARRLKRVECPTVTQISDEWPVFWDHARGSAVVDVDGNTYLDFSGAFGVSFVGHSHPKVVEAARVQSDKLIHGMGDVHPPALKVELAERLADIAPGECSQTIFSCNGSDAVESALKTAFLYTKKPGVISFNGAYHGLGYGALSVTERAHFREPFADQLGIHTIHLPYPKYEDGNDEVTESAP